MDKSTISAMLLQANSSLRATDVLASRKYLSEKGYEVQRMLGCGTFGAVMLGQNIFNQKKVAIKLMYFENEEQLLSFTQEFTLMKKIESEYTVRLLDQLCDLDNNYFFLVMNLEENGNLETFISNNPDISDAQIITLFIQILKGLIYLKQNKIIHGDLKPENVLLSSINSPKLADFGLSTQLLGSRFQQTNKGGNLCYESPEQHLDKKSQIESDWFAAGLILYRLCGNYDIPQMLQMKFGNFPDISKLRHQNIVRVAFKMLATVPSKRATPEMVISELQTILQSHPSLSDLKQVQKKQKLTSKITIHQKNNKKDKNFNLISFSQVIQIKQQKEFNTIMDTTKERPQITKEMDKANISSVVGTDMKGSTRMINKMAKVNSSFMMGTDMKVSGRIVNSMARVNSSGVKGTDMKVNGRMVNSMAKVRTKLLLYDLLIQTSLWASLGTYFYCNGQRYEGQWKEDKWHGQGKFFKSNGIIMEGEFKEDQFDGNGRKIDSKGKLIEQGKYEKGVLIVPF